MSKLDKSFAFVMAVEAQREAEKEDKDKKERDIYAVRKREEKLVVALQSFGWSYNCSELVALDEEDLEYLYKKHKAKLKDHLLRNL